MTLLFTLIALLVLAGLFIFQIALILGAPIGKFAWGGAHNRLPRHLRIASASSLVLYALFALFIADNAGIVSVITDERIMNIGMWAFTVYFFVGIAMNAISRSKPERNLMTPIAAILAISFFVVAVS